MKSPYFDDVRSIAKVRNKKKQIDLSIEHKEKVSLNELRTEFIKLFDEYALKRKEESIHSI